MRVHLCTLEACVWDQKNNHSVLTPAEVTAEVNALNQEERAKAKALGATDVIDEARAAELQDPNDLRYYYPDHLHLTPTANRVKAQIYERFLDIHE